MLRIAALKLHKKPFNQILNKTANCYFNGIYRMLCILFETKHCNLIEAFKKFVTNRNLLLWFEFENLKIIPPCFKYSPIPKRHIKLYK